MDHASVKKNLSAYLDGAVTPEERALLEEHLEGCAECRSELRELAETVSRLRNLGEVEPPPWLTVKVMARVREEAGQERGLLRRLFLSFGWKLPVEAAALAFLTVTGFLLYRAVSPEVGSVVPTIHESREKAAVPAPSTAPPRKPAGGAGPGKESSEARKAPPEAGRGADKARSGAEPSQPPVGGTAAPVPAAPPAAMPGRMLEKSEGPSKGYRDDVWSERDQAIRPEKGAPSAETRAKSLAAPAGERMRLQVVVEDLDAAVRDVRAAARRSGGTAVRGESGVGEGILVVHVERKRLRQFLDLLSGIGEVHQQALLPNSDETALEVVIEIQE
jgi:hypothetical protein